MPKTERATAQPASRRARLAMVERRGDYENELIETRAIPADGLQARAASDGSAPVIEGYAAVVGQWANIGPWLEMFAPGAFDDVLAAGPDCRHLENHEGIPFARTKSGTLKLSADAHGLRFVASLSPKSTRAMDAHDAVQRGDVDQCSIAFIVGEERWEYAADGTERRTIVRISELFDTSHVTYPAYEGTFVQARGAAAETETRSSEEEELDAGEMDEPDGDEPILEPDGDDGEPDGDESPVDGDLKLRAAMTLALLRHQI